MLRLFLCVWLVAGAVLASAYFSTPVQRSVSRSRAHELLRDAQLARGRAATRCAADDRGPGARAEADAEWKKALEAADKAIAAFPESSEPAGLLARALRAEALAQTGSADVAYEELRNLEELAANGGNGEALEAVQATLAKTAHQIALMVRKESSDDADWVKYSETACAYYKDLLKNARDETTRDAYRKNLACATRFRYETGESTSWCMPGVPTVDCKKKMHRLERQQPRGRAARQKYVPPTPDAEDPLRRDQINKTKEGKDKGR